MVAQTSQYQIEMLILTSKLLMTVFGEAGDRGTLILDNWTTSAACSSGFFFTRTHSRWHYYINGLLSQFGFCLLLWNPCRHKWNDTTFYIMICQLFLNTENVTFDVSFPVIPWQFFHQKYKNQLNETNSNSLCCLCFSKKHILLQLST